jgi:hypothetical protein
MKFFDAGSAASQVFGAINSANQMFFTFAIQLLIMVTMNTLIISKL